MKKNKQKIVILGAGGNSIDIVDIVNRINAVEHKTEYEIIGFLDDNKKLGMHHGVTILGNLNLWKNYSDVQFVFAIASVSNYKFRNQILNKFNIMPENFATLIDPFAVVSQSAVIGKGSVIFSGAFIGNNVVVGNHVMILPGAVVNHDCKVGDFSLIGSNASLAGGVLLEKNCFVGMNASIKGNVSVGTKSLIGMGSVVLNNVDTNSTVVGVPATLLD